jgi:hypothetical protein
VSAYDPPSSLRIPLSVLVGVVVPPLGLMLWIGLSGSQRRQYLESNWVRTGFGLAVGSFLPLLAFIAAASLGLLADPNPNPIGLGFLFLVGAAAGTTIAAIGVMRADAI